MTPIYVLTAIMCAVACLGLTFAIGADWRNVRPAWRPVMIAGALEQGALLYVSLWLAKQRLDAGLAAVILALTVAGVALAAVHALVVAWRTGELTSPDPRSGRE